MEPWFKLLTFILCFVFIETINGKQKDGKQVDKLYALHESIKAFKKREFFKMCLKQENKEMENKNGTHTTLPFYL